MLEDKKIIKLFFDRSENAIKELDAKYGRLLSALSYRILVCWQDAEECVNDAYLAAFTGLCGFAYAMAVYQGVGSTSSTDFEKLTQPFGTIASEQFICENENTLFIEKSSLIDDYTNVYADHSVCVMLEGNQIPSIYFSPAYMVIFTCETQQGHILKQGETLTLNFSLYETQSLELEIGYILDGEYHILSLTKGRDFTETLTAPESGQYCFCVTNHSSSNAVIAHGSIDAE